MPDAVDPRSGHRGYPAAQVGRARLVAALRRAGMPLARVREVVDLDPAARRTAVSRWWDGVEEEVRGQAGFPGILRAYDTVGARVDAQGGSGPAARPRSVPATGTPRRASRTSRWPGPWGDAQPRAVASRAPKARRAQPVSTSRARRTGRRARTRRARDRPATSSSSQTSPTTAWVSA